MDTKSVSVCPYIDTQTDPPTFQAIARISLTSQQNFQSQFRFFGVKRTRCMDNILINHYTKHTLTCIPWHKLSEADVPLLCLVCCRAGGGKAFPVCCLIV